LIGISATGTELGCSSGIVFNGNSHDNIIGGTSVGDGNTIAYAQSDAIWVLNNSGGTKNSFLGNTLFNNHFGIDLGDFGVTPNDTNDVDTGPNNLQNFPLITTVTPNGNSAAIAGTLNSVSNTQYRIELFANLTCNQMEGEGKSFLAPLPRYLVSNNGNVNITVPFDVFNNT
jgi:hypothetical protein